MSHDDFVALPHGATGLSGVCNCGIHTHLLFLIDFYISPVLYFSFKRGIKHFFQDANPFSNHFDRKPFQAAGYLSK